LFTSQILDNRKIPQQISGKSFCILCCRRGVPLWLHKDEHYAGVDTGISCWVEAFGGKKRNLSRQLSGNPRRMFQGKAKQLPQWSTTCNRGASACTILTSQSLPYCPLATQCSKFFFYSGSTSFSLSLSLSLSLTHTHTLSVPLSLSRCIQNVVGRAQIFADVEI
jgi:hypothetical protein